MAELKRAYLFHGDDHARIGERRAGLRVLAERESGAAGLEILEGDGATADAAVGALSALTFALGRRFVVVDGVERWTAADADRVASALATLTDDITVAFFAREEGRAKVPKKLADAIIAAGGDVREEAMVKPWELPKWVTARGRELGLTVEPGAAKALVAHVGERQARLVRELEKLALALPANGTVTPELVDELSAPSAERKAWTLADALVAGDGAAALRAYLDLRAQGERLPGLIYQMVRRLRDALGAATRLEAGEAPAQVKRSLRMPPRAAERFLGDVRRTDSATLRDALTTIADLELASRGGGAGILTEDTRAVRALADIAA